MTKLFSIPSILLTLLIPPTVWSANLLDHVFTPGIAHAIHVQGNYAYIASANNSPDLSSEYDELQIVDISDPNHLNLVSRTEFRTRGIAIHGIYVKGVYAYLATGAEGLYVVDISDPYRPELIQNYSLGRTSGVFAVGEYIYVTGTRGGLKIITGNPRDMYEIGASQIPSNYPGYVGAKDIVVKENYAYVAYGDAGLQIFNISDPRNPFWVGEYVYPHCFSNAISINEEYAYVGCTGYEWGLQVINISNPRQPVLARYYETLDGIEDIFIKGPMVYIAYISGVEILDVEDPYNPVQCDSYDTPVQAYGISAKGEFVYIADGWEGGMLAISSPCGRESPADELPQFKTDICIPSGFSWSNNCPKKIDKKYEIKINKCMLPISIFFKDCSKEKKKKYLKLRYPKIIKNSL